MKKSLIRIGLFTALFVAIASFGGTMTSAHAQSLTSSQQAALQQQLDDAKAQLVQLQMQEGQVPEGDSALPGATTTVAPSVTITPVTTGSPTMTVTATPSTMTTMSNLSASNIAAINSALTALTGVLVNLQSELATNPQLIATNGTGVVSALQGVSNVLATISTDIQNGSVAMTMPSVSSNAGTAMGTGSTAPNSAAGTAVTTPSTGSAGSTGAAGVAMTTSTSAAGAGTAATQPTTAPIVSANPTPAAQTAQASTSFSASKLNWPLIIVIILIVAAIAIWLWWDDSDEDKKQPVIRTTSPSPQRPQQPLQSTTNQTVTLNQGQNGNRQPANSQTPLSSAVAPNGSR